MGTSLDPYRQTVPPPSGLERCPRKIGWRLRNLVTGEVVPARCESNRCAYCLPRNARRRGLAIGYACPERAITLTQVGDDPDVVRARMKRVRYDLVQAVGRFEWVWHVEPNPRGTGHHVHAWQHGDFVPQKTLSAIAQRRGMGEVAWIERVRASSAAGGYGMKLAGIDYGMKAVTAELDEAATVYLQANKGRLHHQSRGYWRHPNGESIEGVKAAVRAAEAAVGRPRPDEWVMEREAAGAI